MVPLAKGAENSRTGEEASKTRVSLFLSPILYKRLVKPP